ncbi:MAG TPA: CoA transferase [Streptosporangiaceae bacterium]|nr:CoA transferase [Streptosporangiaceae bacterium]
MRAPIQDEALAGLRVLELASLYAGPLIGTNLADFGADVIKIEHPLGDEARRWGVSKDGVPLWWKVIARNKRLLALDLHQPEDREVARRLAVEADVLIENFRPGRLAQWGLGYPELSKLNPRLIMVSVTGFGQTGPRSAEPGFGTLAEAFSGFAYITGHPGGPPTLPPFGLADGVAASIGTSAVMMALYWRDARGGSGQAIDLSLYEPLFSILGPQVIEYTQTGKMQEREGNRSPRTSPRNAYQTSDGHWVAVSAGTQQIADRVFTAIGEPDWPSDPRFSTARDRRENAELIEQTVAEWFGRHTLDEALACFAAMQAPIAPVYNTAQIVVDPHYLARNSFVRVPDPDLGEVTMQNVAPRLSRTPGRIRHAGKTAIGADMHAGPAWLDSGRMTPGEVDG